MANRAAIYVRVSTDSEEQKLSPEHQLAECKEYAEEVGLQFDPSLVYNDAGLSGTEMENRAEVQRMLSDARLGQFDAVLFTAISRFSRDLSDALSLKKKFEQVYGIRLISKEEGYDSAIEGRNSDMVFTVHAMLAAHKSQEMSTAIKRGLRQSARSGRHIGNVTPYGFAKTEDRRLIPDPKTAPIVQNIFQWYLDGLGSRSIVDRLNERGIVSAKGKPWQPSTIVAILHNRAYRGDIVAHKWTMETDFEHSRRIDKRVKRQSTRNEDEWVIVEGAHEPIVDPDTFDRVQHLLETKATNRSITRKSNLLAGLLHCKECGGAMIVSSSRNQNYKYIMCSQVKRLGKSYCVNHSSQKYQPILGEILEYLSQAAKQPDWIDSVVEMVKNKTEGSPEDTQKKIEVLRHELGQNEVEQVKNLEAYTSGLFALKVIEARQQQLISQAEHIQKEITRLQAQTVDQESAIRTATDIKEALHVFAHFNEYDDMTQRLSLQKVIRSIDFDKDGDIVVNWTWTTNFAQTTI